MGRSVKHVRERRWREAAKPQAAEAQGCCYQTRETMSGAEHAAGTKYFGASYHGELVRDTEQGPL